jgi:hypothetical protein
MAVMRTIRLTALLSIALTMGLVTMDAAHASSIVYTKGSGSSARAEPSGRTGTARTIARGAIDPDWGPAPAR